jgi:hypothetical protein
MSSKSKLAGPCSTLDIATVHRSDHESESMMMSMAGPESPHHAERRDTSSAITSEGRGERSTSRRDQRCDRRRRSSDRRREGQLHRCCEERPDRQGTDEATCEEERSPLRRGRRQCRQRPGEAHNEEHDTRRRRRAQRRSSPLLTRARSPSSQRNSQTSRSNWAPASSATTSGRSSPPSATS